MTIEVAQNDGKAVLKLAGLVTQVFEITRLDSGFPIHDSVESARSTV